MEKYSRCVLGICDNNMQCPGMHENYNNVDGYIIMQKLPKDGAVRVVRINAISNGRKQTIQ